MASGARALGRLCPSSTALLVCDVQERFRPLICGFPAVADAARRMVRGAAALGVPVLATEQYPEKLGATVAEVGLLSGAPVVGKTRFSMMVPEVRQWLAAAAGGGGGGGGGSNGGGGNNTPTATNKIRSVMIVGIEAHVCVLQTALDLLADGVDVHLITDGVSSQRAADRAAGLARAAQSGAFLTTSDSALFELAGDAKHPAFKQISAIAREPRPTESVEQAAWAALSAKL
jgi:nicotinamidase-related amidase